MHSLIENQDNIVETSYNDESHTRQNVILDSEFNCFFNEVMYKSITEQTFIWANKLIFEVKNVIKATLGLFVLWKFVNSVCY